MRFVDMADIERFFIRTLLCHLPGATSFEDLRTLPDKTVANTFKEAALARGFCENDKEYLDILQVRLGGR